MNTQNMNQYYATELSPNNSSFVFTASEPGRGLCDVGQSISSFGNEEDIVRGKGKKGQATDSHRKAERVRREKINKKMSCLKELVPGCNKSMGMAVMLDEIINYVHSLQHQVEFLSMELAAACSSCSLERETESIQKNQGTISEEANEIEESVTERYEHSFSSTFSFFDQF